MRTSRLVLRASTPWSNSSPRGPDCLVRRLHVRVSQCASTHPASSNQRCKDLRLRAIHRVKGLVKEQSNGPREVNPSRAVLIERGVIPQKGQKIGNDKQESRQGNHIWRHSHGETVNDKVGVERLEDVLGHQRAINRRVLVFPQRGQLMLPYVDHFDNCSKATVLFNSQKKSLLRPAIGVPRV